ncbi:hypothetical protein [Austwickia sp. TVS 96-490-7B]|uniref:hypothetical protein n=1 Tax=Austwickia sp. TVS 96-490-7B TaxID=2830843 RepID=UPI001C5779CD|nr:hypothetical protein [Austwickia sp. TVS 96-490-7B]
MPLQGFNQNWVGLLIVQLANDLLGRIGLLRTPTRKPSAGDPKPMTAALHHRGGPGPRKQTTLSPHQEERTMG